MQGGPGAAGLTCLARCCWEKPLSWASTAASRASIRSGMYTPAHQVVPVACSLQARAQLRTSVRSGACVPHGQTTRLRLPCLIALLTHNAAAPGSPSCSAADAMWTRKAVRHISSMSCTPCTNTSTAGKPGRTASVPARSWRVQRCSALAAMQGCIACVADLCHSCPAALADSQRDVRRRA